MLEANQLPPENSHVISKKEHAISTYKYMFTNGMALSNCTRATPVEERAGCTQDTPHVVTVTYAETPKSIDTCTT